MRSAPIKQHPYSPALFCFCFSFYFFSLSIRLFLSTFCARSDVEQPRKLKRHMSFSVSFALPFPRSLPVSPFPNPLPWYQSSPRHTKNVPSWSQDKMTPSDYGIVAGSYCCLPSYLIRYCWIVWRSGNMMLHTLVEVGPHNSDSALASGSSDLAVCMLRPIGLPFDRRLFCGQTVGRTEQSRQVLSRRLVVVVVVGLG